MAGADAPATLVLLRHGRAPERREPAHRVYDAVVPDLRAVNITLLAAHGSSLRALVKHLDGISDEDITERNIPTGMPRVFELGADLRPLETKPLTERYLDPEAAAAAAAAAKQAG